MPLIGHANVEIRAVDKFFERDVRKIVGNLKDVQVKFKADVDMKPVYNKIRTLRKSPLINKPIILHVGADSKKFTDHIEKIVDEYDDRTLSVTVEETGLDEIQAKARAIRRTMEETKTRIKADVDTVGASARLALLTRPRMVPIGVKLDDETIAGLKGFFYTLTGGIPVAKVKTALTGMAANFEGISVKAGIASSAISFLVGTAVHGAGDLLAIGGDITQVVGLLNALPAAIGAGGLMLTGTILGWKGFGKALTGEGKEAAEALASLPPEAQRAVKALDGFGHKIREVTQTSYWKSMGTSVQDAKKAIEKDLVSGMDTAGKRLGKQMATIMGSFEEFGSSGGLGRTFKSLNDFLKTSTPAMGSFTSGFLEMMEGGARSMPAFGTWLSKISGDFQSWAQNANDTGMIDQWISTAVQRVQELGNVVKGTYGLFTGLTNAARNAGMNGLTELSEGMLKIGEAAQSPGFQKGLTSFFTSSRKAMENSADGFKGFFKLVGDGLPTINTAMETSGSIIGAMMKNITRAFTNTGLGDGFIKLLSGMKDGATQLAPGFEHLGHALGRLSEVGGEVIRNVAPGLVQLFETVDIVVSGMADGIIDALPVFNTFIQGLLSAIKSVVGPIAALVGGVLTTFAKLPGGLQTALMAMGSFAIAMALINKKFPQFTQGMSNMRTTASDTARGVSRAFGVSSFVGPLTAAQAGASKTLTGMVDSHRNSVSKIRGIWQTANFERHIAAASATAASPKMFAGAIANMSAVGRTSKVVGGQITKGIGKAIGGLSGALGGPWGLAITGTIAGMAAIGAASAASKERVEALYQTMSQTGKIEPATKDSMAEMLFNNKGSVLDKTDAFLHFQNGAANVGKSLDKAGISSRDLVDGLVSGGTESVEIWKKLQNATSGGGLSGKNLMRMDIISEDELKKIGVLDGKLSNLSSRELNNVAESMGDLSKETKEAIAKADHLKKSYGDLAKDQISNNKTVLESQATSLDEKMAAFKSNMQMGGLEQLTQQSGFYQLGVAMEQNKSQFKAMGAELKKTGGSFRDTFDLVDVGNSNIAMFKMNTSTGRQMYDVMRTSADGIHAATMSTYDTVLKQTDNVGLAQKAALATASGETEKFVKQLPKSLSDVDIAALLDTAGLSDTDIEIALKTKGIDEAISEALRVEAALIAFRTGDYSAVITVMGDKAKSEIASVLGIAKDFSAQKFEKEIRANFANEGEYDAWMAEFNKSTEPQRVQMVAELENKTAVAALSELEAKGSKINGKTWKATIASVAKSEGVTPEALTAAINNIPKETLAKIIGKVEGDPTDEIEKLVGSKTFKAAIKAVLEGKGGVEGELRGIEAPVKAVPDSGGTWFSSLASKFSTPIEQRITPTVGDIPKISIPDATANVIVKADPGKLDSVKTSIAGVKDKSVSVKVSADPGKINSVKSAIAGVKDKTVSVKASADPGKVNSVKTAIAGVKSKNVSVTAKASASQVNSVKTAIAAVKSKSVAITVTASASQVNTLKSAIAAVKAKSVKITATAPPAAVNTLKAAIDKVKGKSVSVTASAPAGAVNALRAAIAGVRSKTVTVTVRTNNQNNNGGMYMGNVRTFASGGMDKVQKAIERHKRIGGSENRVAQIAKGSENYRVWGETETQGEAYIPLGKNKRSRSLKILQQVMDHFGVEAAQTFSNGGVLAGKAMGAGITTFASGGVSNSTAAKKAAKKAASDAKKAAAAAKKVAEAERKVKKEQAQYNAINSKKVNAKKKKAAKAELDAAKKQLATAKKTQSAAKKAQTSSKDALKKQQEITNNASKDKRAVLTGFRNDVNNQFGNQKSPLQSSIAGLRKEASSFISTYKKTRPKEAKAMEKVSKKLAAQASVSKGYTKEVNKYGGTVASARLADRVQKAQKSKTKKDDVLKGITLRDYELAISRTETAREKAETELAKLEQERKSVIDSIKTSVSGEFDLKDFAGGTNKAGFRNSMTAKGLSSYAKDKLTKIQNFSKLVKDLLGAGYNPSLVQEIALMGVEDGTSLAQALMKDKSQKNSLNASYVGIDKAATSMGTAVGDKMYNAGINLNKGLIAGLKADEKALKEAAVHLGDILYKEFKKALGIKSPSRVMAELGKFIPQGVALGIDSEQDVVKKSIQNLVRPADLTLNGNKTANGLPPLVKPTSSNGIIGGVVPEVHVHPSPGMDEVLVGQAAAREMMYRLQ